MKVYVSGNKCNVSMNTTCDETRRAASNQLTQLHSEDNLYRSHAFLPASQHELGKISPSSGFALQPFTGTKTAAPPTEVTASTTLARFQSRPSRFYDGARGLGGEKVTWI